MSKFRKVLSALTSVAIASSMFTSLAAKAFDASISYADGKATATASGKLIAASYDESGVLTGIKLHDATADTPVDVKVSEGDKLMLWNSVDGENAMKPLTDAYTVEASPEETEPPVETQTPVAPVETQTPVVTQAPDAGNKIYIDEQFTYDDQTIIASVGNDVEKAPDPVTLGSIVYAAGRRANAKEINNNAKISGNQLLISADGFATSERGVAFTFASDAAIPTTADLAEGQVLEMSFDVTTSGTFEVSGYGELSTADLTTGAVHACIVLDKDAAMQYLIVTDANGTLINSKSAALTATTFTGMSFRVGSTTTYIDNLKVETKDKDAGVVTFSVKDSSDAAVEGAAIKINDNYSVTTGADGTATAALPNGTYTAEASKSGYEHTKGLLDPDTADFTVSSNMQDVAFTISLSSYDIIPNEELTVIGGGQTFIAAPKDAAFSTSEAFTVSVFDQFGIEVTDPAMYTLSWEIYPTGTDNADSNVSIDENGVVSVSKNFSTDSSVAVYDVVAKIIANNDGLRGINVKKPICVGNNDVIHYEPIGWTTTSRDETKSLSAPITLPDVSSITIDVSMAAISRHHRTIALMTDAGALAGIQLRGEKTDYNQTIFAWTGTTQKNNEWNQWSFVNSLTNSEVLMTDYAKGTTIEVTFTIDTTNKAVTISCGDVQHTLPYTIDAKTFTGFRTGEADSTASFTMNAVKVVEPDANYLSISGDLDFAKIYGNTVTREYSLGQSVVVPDETFTWTVSPAEQGVTVENGVLSVADTATAGSYILTATSDMNSEKIASVTVDIGDFQEIAAANATVTGARALAGAGATEKYAVTKLVDSYGDDVTALLPAAEWSSSNTDVATIDATTGELTTTGFGQTVITATITNGTAVTRLTVPVTVAQYYITADATGDSTTVDTSNLVTDSAITGYQVTTSKEGKIVKQEVVETAPTTVDTTGADKLEIAPVFTYTDITPYVTATADIPADTYNFVISEASGTHFDPYVNDQMLANNMLQGGSAVTSIAVNDIVVAEGYATLSLRDYASNSKAGKITVVKSPSIVDRTKKVYVLGDSLVCIYANGGDKDHNYQTGMGQVLQNYLTDDVEVVDLGNSGVIAEGLATSAITQIIESAKPGDIMLLESGYNDRSNTTKDKMLAAVKYMYEAAKDKGVDVVLVSPPSSAHDYKADVAWTSVMKQAADETGAKYFDLAAASYKFFNDTYGDSFSDASVYSVYNVSDRLHSTFHGANKIASIMADGMIALGFGDIVNTEYVYTFNDNQSNTITCQATASQGSSGSSAEDVAKQSIAQNGVQINEHYYKDVETLTLEF